MIKEFLAKFRGRFANVKMRTLVILIGGIIGIITFIIWTSPREETTTEVVGSSTPKKIGNIESLPGTGEQNLEYEALQRAENLRKAEQAKESGGSAVARLLNPANENTASLGFGQEYCEECTYDKTGYDKNGYDARGFDKNGFNRAGFDADGYDKDGYDKDGFDRNGCNRQGLDREGKPCYDAAGYTAAGYDKMGFGQDGFNKEGYDRDGFDKNGFDKHGYDKDGFDKNGFDRDGYDRDGYDKDGYDRDGYDRDGFDRNGCNRQGVNRQGLPCTNVGQAVVATNAVPGGVPGATQQAQEAYQRLLEEEKNREAERLKELEEQQRLAMLAEERARQQAFEALLQHQSNSMLMSWKPSTQVYVAGVNLNSAELENAAGNLATGGAGGSAEANKGPVLYKAGDIIYAVLETSLNSDEPGPVLARIVHGPLSGSKVIGELERQHDKLYLSFKMLSSPNMPESIAFDAVAIDPETARTVLATDVDNHYLLRYGTLFASSFLEGVGDAVQSGLGSPNLEVVDGVVIGESIQATGREQFLVGLGTVGAKIGEEIDYFNIPPTVTLDSGTSMGLLIIKDLRIEPVGDVLPAEAYTAGTVGPNAPHQPQTQQEAIQKGATPSNPLPQGAVIYENVPAR